MAIITAEQTSPQSNPLDILEELVAANEWRFDSSSDEEMVVELNGRWCDYRMFFAWQEDLSAMYFSCLFDLRVPPHKRGSIAYSLEYGLDEMEMHEDAVAKDDRVILVDDLIATGGTAEGAVKLLRQLGAQVLAACFIIDLPDLGGAAKLRRLEVPVRTLVTFEGH